MAKTIAVVGVTGTQGGSVARTFLAQGWSVRGITRSSQSAAAQLLRSQGVEIVEADLDKPASLISAFSGVEVIFAVTDFWAPFFGAYGDLSKISDRSTGEHAMAIEIQRGHNLVDAAAQVLKEGVLQRFVLSTLPDLKKQSKGKYTYNYHFDGKARISDYLKTKKELWEKSSLLNAGFYTTNIIKYGALRGGKQTGSGKFILRNPGSTKALHPWFVPDDTGLFVDLLVRSPPKQDLLGVSEMASYDTYANIWTEVTGVPSEAQEMSIAEADKAAPGGLGREAAESSSTSAEFGWGDHLILPKDLDSVLKTTSLKEYMENENWTDFLSKI